MPREIVFAFGNTHTVAEKIFENVLGHRRVEAYNTGVWHTKLENWLHSAKFFVVKENGDRKLRNIELSADDLATVEPFNEG